MLLLTEIGNQRISIEFNGTCLMHKYLIVSCRISNVLSDTQECAWASVYQIRILKTLFADQCYYVIKNSLNSS